jgi:hypothetical protein
MPEMGIENDKFILECRGVLGVCDANALDLDANEQAKATDQRCGHVRIRTERDTEISTSKGKQGPLRHNPLSSTRHRFLYRPSNRNVLDTTHSSFWQAVLNFDALPDFRVARAGL